MLSPRSWFVSKGRKKKTKKQWDEGQKRISVARVYLYLCIFVEHALRSTSFVLGVGKKSEVPICSARTSLTYPSSICQAKLLAIVARLSLSLFFKENGHGPDNLFSNIREVPAKTSKSRKIHIVAGRRFWRFLLVNQLSLSIIALHAQYRATAPLNLTKGFTSSSQSLLKG